MSELWQERAVQLGPRKALLGIVTTRSSESEAPAARPLVVILNTGIIHRVGHRRMFVTLARALAMRGCRVLRFDFAGIGDSPPRPDALAPLDACLADLREAIDDLTARMLASHLILIGICSGADAALLYGHTDARISGLILIDPTIPATTRFYIHYVSARAQDWRLWGKAIVGRSTIFRVAAKHLFYSMFARRKPAAMTLDNLRFHPGLAQTYHAIVAQGIRLLAVFTGEDTRQSYRNQIIDALPQVSLHDQLELAFFSESDHLFSSPQDRERLNQRVIEWVAALLATPHAVLADSD